MVVVGEVGSAYTGQQNVDVPAGSAAFISGLAVRVSVNY